MKATDKELFRITNEDYDTKTITVVSNSWLSNAYPRESIEYAISQLQWKRRMRELLFLGVIALFFSTIAIVIGHIMPLFLGLSEIQAIGAFILSLIGGTIGTILLTNPIMTYIKRRRWLK